MKEPALVIHEPMLGEQALLIHVFYKHEAVSISVWFGLCWQRLRTRSRQLQRH
jgi:hypothetical protein